MHDLDDLELNDNVLWDRDTAEEWRLEWREEEGVMSGLGHWSAGRKDVWCGMAYMVQETSCCSDCDSVSFVLDEELALGSVCLDLDLDFDRFSLCRFRLEEEMGEFGLLLLEGEERESDAAWRRLPERRLGLGSG